MTGEIFPDDFRICAVCGRVLDGVRYGDEPKRYDHVLTPPGDDHVAVPVHPREAAAPPLLRCDFCFADDPAWKLPVRDFQAIGPAVSVLGWAACDECAKLIDRNQWTALVRRVVVSYRQRHPDAQIDDVERSLRDLYRTLRRNIIGALRPLER